MAVAGPILELDQVSKSYEAPGGDGTIAVLRGISLQFSPGESVAIVGPSGSGKSTLLHVLGTLDRPTSGTVRLEGQEVSSLSDEQLARVRNRRIGFVFQAHYLLPQCTILENVLLPTLGGDAGRASPQEITRAEGLLRRVGLGDRLKHRPGELSGGERQRAAVARALMNRPVLLLADEPTGSLDQASAKAIAELLAKINQQEQVTVVVVTHALDLARQMARVLELKDGTLVQHSSGPADALP